MEPWETPALTRYSCEDFPSRATQSCILLLFIHFHLFSHNIKFTPFTTKYKNKTTTIIIIMIIITIYMWKYIIDDSNKIFLVQ